MSEMMNLDHDVPTGRSLTRRELQCAKMTAEGLSAKQIGLNLKIAPRTVERHLDQARIKLLARNRAHLVAAALRRGLI